MKKSNTAKLKKKYPKLLKDITEIWCEDGWYRLVDDMLEEINALCPKAKILQIKEKFARLVCYVEPFSESDNKEMLNLTQKYHQLSGNICEETGGIGCLHTNGSAKKTLSPMSACLLGYKKVEDNERNLNPNYSRCR